MIGFFAKITLSPCFIRINEVLYFLGGGSWGSKDGFVFHDTRHCFNTNMRKAGVPESVIMKITGHSTREMFLRYDSVDASDTRKAVEQMEGFLKSVDQNVDQALQNATWGYPMNQLTSCFSYGAEAGI